MMMDALLANILHEFSEDASEYVAAMRAAMRLAQSGGFLLPVRP